MKSQLPQKEGVYIWYILDLNYLEIGLVQVLKDRQKQLDYLATRENKDGHFFIYNNDNGECLTMYHQASSHHLPPMNATTHEPFVDGYTPTTVDYICKGLEQVENDD